MRVKISAFKWVVAGWSALVIALSSVGLAGVGGSSYSEGSRFYKANGQKWDHKLACSMYADDGDGERVGESFVWVRSTGKRQSSAMYFLARDASFDTPILKPSMYSRSFWHGVEGGEGPNLCLDQSATGEGATAVSYCALALNYNSLELVRRTPSAVDGTRGICRVIEAPKRE